MTKTRGEWRSLLGAGVACLLIWGSTVIAGPQAGRQGTPTLIIDSLAGGDTYDRYCSTCHGKGGHGDGSVAPSLESRPPDLTTLSRRNGGTFPRDRVLASVTNVARPIGAHGTGEMPVWGQIFPALDSNHDRVTVRLEQVVDYVATMQATATPPVDAGRDLFLTHCASCHGANARGNGPMADRLRNQPPDLTTFTARNGGTFPSARIRDIIDGRAVASHGTREMPVWGNGFSNSRGGYGADEIKRRIEALVKHLESIQSRGV